MPEAQNKIDLEVSSNEVLNTPVKSITNQEIPKTLTPTTRKKKLLSRSNNIVHRFISTHQGR